MADYCFSMRSLTPRRLEGAQVMANFIQLQQGPSFVQLHQGQRLVLINLDQVKAITSKESQPGSRMLFSDGSEIDVDEVLADIETMIRLKP
jgi:hypothetical protein